MGLSGPFYLGTTIKISTILNIDVASTATITIKDASDATKVSGASMSKEQNQVYFYIWQSTNATTDNSGTYTAEITITSGGYTSYTEKTFEMIDPD